MKIINPSIKLEDEIDGQEILKKIKVKETLQKIQQRDLSRIL